MKTTTYTGSMATVTETLVKMLGGQHKQITINGRKVRLVCTTVGEKHAYVNGKRIDLGPQFATRLAAEVGA